ncbi:MAG: prolyl oligopeptidase family serine peptidase [Kiritimatiellales bacterium]
MNALLTVLGAAVFAGNIAGAEIQKSTFEQMPYQLSSPQTEQGKLYPLVICLHGAAGRGTDNEARGIEAYAVLRTPEMQEKYPAFLLAPQCDKGFQWVDAPWAKGSYDLDQVPESVYMKKVYALILQLIKDYPVDRTRIYVTGQSMGGFGTWNMVLNHPELFAAAIPICGGGSPDHAERIKTIPIRFFHGAKDTVVPTDASRDMAAALEKAGSSVFKYTELPNGTHIIMKEVWATPGLIDWLFEQKKKVEQ